MFLILCIVGLVGAIIATALIFLFHRKKRSIVLPYILFFVFIAVFGVGTFFYLGEGVLFGTPTPKITSLIGEWHQVDPASEDTRQIAIISEDTIEIFWYTPSDPEIDSESDPQFDSEPDPESDSQLTPEPDFESREPSALYWSGSFEVPDILEDTYSWTSINDKEKTASGLFVSREEEKVFTYSKGQLTYEISVLGVTKTIRLEKNEPDIDPNESNYLGIGDTLETEYFQFTIQKIATASSITNSIGVTYTPEEGHVFLIAVITSKNTSDETKNVMNTNFNSYVDGEKIVVHSVIGEVDGNMPLSGAVSSGMEFTAYTVWELPQDWSSLQFSYLDALTGSESSAYAIHPEDTVQTEP